MSFSHESRNFSPWRRPEDPERLTRLSLPAEFRISRGIYLLIAAGAVAGSFAIGSGLSASNETGTRPAVWITVGALALAFSAYFFALARRFVFVVHEDRVRFRNLGAWTEVPLRRLELAERRDFLMLIYPGGRYTLPWMVKDYALLASLLRNLRPPTL